MSEWTIQEGLRWTPKCGCRVVYKNDGGDNQRGYMRTWAELENCSRHSEENVAALEALLWADQITIMEEPPPFEFKDFFEERADDDDDLLPLGVW